MNNKQEKKHNVFKYVTMFLFCIIIFLLLLIYQNSDNENDKTKQNQKLSFSFNKKNFFDSANNNNSSTYLYFANKNNTFLTAKQEQFKPSINTIDYAKKIINALIMGPKEGKLNKTLPSETKLRSLYISEDQTAYVDLSEEVRDNQAKNIQNEILSIYSIVNSLIQNIPDIKSVKILIAGQDVMTFAGHIDIRNPLKANILLIR